MKFFIDTANINEIKEAHSLGLVDGVTTNPTLIAIENREFSEILKDIIKVINGPISVEALSLDHDGIVKEAKNYSALSENIVIKVPLTQEGLKAARTLSKLKIKTNVTLVFSPTQALLAAKAGATYVSPFVGRLDDVSSFGINIVEDILLIYENYGYMTEIIVASIRNPLHVLDAATMGAHIATMPFKVMLQLANHPLTDIGIKKFLEDWEKVPKRT